MAKESKVAPTGKAVKADAKKTGEFAKQNSAIKKDNEKTPALQLVNKRIAKQLECSEKDAAVLFNVCIAAIQEVTVIKGTLGVPGLAKFETADKKASTGTIQFGDKTGEKWSKPAYTTVTATNIAQSWKDMANDDLNIRATDELESIFGGDEEPEDDAEEEVPAPKKAVNTKAPTKTAVPAKTAVPVKKTPTKK